MGDMGGIEEGVHDVELVSVKGTFVKMVGMNGDIDG